MMDFDKIREAGISTSSNKLLTNPIRRLAFKILKPYLYKMYSQLDSRLDWLKKDVTALNARFETVENNLNEVTMERKAALSRQSQSSIMDGYSHDTLDEFFEVSLFESKPPSCNLNLHGTPYKLHFGRYGLFLLKNKDLVSDSISQDKFWDDHLQRIIELASRNGGNAVDAGAFIGFHSIYMSKFFENVYSFEPQSKVFQMLCANVVLNNCNNIHLFNAPLYDRVCAMVIASDSKQEISIPRKDGAINYDAITNLAALTYEVTKTKQANEILSMRLDDLAIENISFIKVDTQGSDLIVLRGAVETIKRTNPVIVFEYEKVFSENHSLTFDEHIEFFKHLGFSLRVVRNQGDKQIDFLALPPNLSNSSSEWDTVGTLFEY
jgi:FkbM family methyltransferase